MIPFTKPEIETPELEVDPVPIVPGVKPVPTPEECSYLADLVAKLIIR